MSYFYHLGIFLAIYSLLAVGLNILVGYCGRLSLAHVIFFSVGGYVYAYATLRLGWGIIGTIILGLAVVIVLGFLYVLASHYRHGDEYVLVSLAVQTLFYSTAFNWYDKTRNFGSLKSFTNGPFGVSGIPRPAWLSVSLSRLSVAALVVAILLIAFVALALQYSWGRALKAMRDDEAVAESLGKDIFRLHLEAVLVASALASVAGGIYALYVSYVDPSLCSLEQAVLVLSMIIVGGIGNLRGPIIGALILVILPEAIKLLPLASSHVENVRVMLYGGALTLAMHFRSQGIAGSYRL